ncbi:hypothetical protein NLX71_24535 [Paenibacillus sp. MZ04-78.2]|uniref:hypothetical protein n=1 Tax=Paenibacillus sp. MZ04-78.2 TaxID=2962034 RepID=UPI0020B7EB5A|nr:hypothetical protein [Paenibacillus sp. MZ04-78.2]MCP3776417.1 hypothetical protein [Paenibacillus sp. MZ04-78.2]
MQIAKQRIVLFILKLIIIGPFWYYAFSLLNDGNGDWNFGLYSFAALLIGTLYADVEKEISWGSKRNIILSHIILLSLFPMLGLFFRSNIMNHFLAGCVILVGINTYMFVGGIIFRKVFD